MDCRILTTVYFTADLFLTLTTSSEICQVEGQVALLSPTQLSLTHLTHRPTSCLLPKMTETPPQNPYPSPQSTRQRLKPALQLETPSRTRSPGSSDTLVSSPEPEEDLGPAFEAQDVVARFA